MADTCVVLPLLHRLYHNQYQHYYHQYQYQYQCYQQQQHHLLFVVPAVNVVQTCVSLIFSAEVM